MILAWASPFTTMGTRYYPHTLQLPKATIGLRVIKYAYTSLNISLPNYGCLDTNTTFSVYRGDKYKDVVRSWSPATLYITPGIQPLFGHHHTPKS